MITEDYISFETAKLLKEKGFEEHVTRYYFTQITYVGFKDYPIGVLYADSYPQNQNNYNNKVAAPTLQMTMKWLREAHDIFISIHRAISGNGYVYYHEIYNGGIAKYAQYGRTYSTYEEACEVAIKYCLENLI